MNKIIPLLLLLANLQAEDTPDNNYNIELLIFGLSAHNHNKNPAGQTYNNTNPGLGIGIVQQNRKIDVTLTAGTYKDSFSNQAQFLLVGIRGIIGERQKLHALLGASGGYYYGSGHQGFGVIPYLGAGYNRIDLCLTGAPTTMRSASSISIFLKMNIWEW